MLSRQAAMWSGDGIHQRRRQPRPLHHADLDRGERREAVALRQDTFMPGRNADSGSTDTAIPAMTAAATTVDDQLVKEHLIFPSTESSAEQAS
jgi:hypothetical protein